ncbi:MAG: MlaD family protein [Pseudomonadota bacterium]
MANDPEIEDAALAQKPAGLRRLSPVWLVPIFAAILGGLVGYNAVSSRGPLVEIEFDSASGIEAGKTHIRHKDVIVGEVEEVVLSEDADSVIVHARLEKEMTRYLGDTTEFWIVSARIDGGQVTGLGTLLSGSFIEMDWSGPATRRVRKMTGLSQAPLTKPGAPGRRVTLRSDTAGSLSVGSPIYFRQIPVGRIESRRLTDDARHVVFDAFIDAPYDQQVSLATRFWNVSGLAVEAGAEGVVVRMESLTTLLSGGLAFEEIGPEPQTPLSEDGTEFGVFASRTEAEESLFRVEEGSEDYRLMARFTESVGGLRPGAPITVEGIVVGRVADVIAQAPDVLGTDLEIYAILQFEPGRLGIGNVPQAEFYQAMEMLVSRGMRVQLASGNLLTGALSVQMHLLDDPEPAAIDYDDEPYPALPTAPSEIAALTSNFEDLLASLSDLPLEELVVAATGLLQQAEGVLANPAMRDLPNDLAELTGSLNDLSQRAEYALSGIDPDSELYVELAAAAAEMRLAARSLAALADRLEEQPNSLLTGR